MPSSVEFVVGNTYQSIPYNQAKLSSNGNRKIHDIVIFMDVVSGDPDIVEKVSFDLGGTFHPPVFTCVSPVPIRIESMNEFQCVSLLCHDWAEVLSYLT